MSERNELILANLIANRCELKPELDVLTFLEIDNEGQWHEEVRTYQNLWDNGQRIAGALREVGMVEGDHFGVIMLNHPEFVEAMVASSIASTVFVPIDPRTKGKKLQYMLAFSECKGVIIGDYALPNLTQILSELPQLQWIWVLTDNNDAIKINLQQDVRLVQEILKSDIPELPILVQDSEQPMQLLFTSGTTGDPKAIVSPYSRFGGIASLGELLGLRDGDRPYTGLSLTHANAQLITLGTTLKMGLRGVISRKFTKSCLWDITRTYGCTTFNLLGGMTNAIYSEPEKECDADNPVRFILSAGMPEAIWEKFSHRFNVEIFEFYAAAEGGLTLNKPGDGPVGSIGKPLPGVRVRIIDDNEKECLAGECGEIVFENTDGSSVPQVNYYKNSQTSADKVRNGRLYMGDIGHQDKDGWIYFDHRKGGGIRQNGDFINPAFIEKELAEHPLIDDVFVYGVPTKTGVAGEKSVTAAVVVNNPAIHSSEIQEIWDYCREKLESSFVPTYIQLMEEIPKTASEKPVERYCFEAFEQSPEKVFTENKKRISV